MSKKVIFLLFTLYFSTSLFAAEPGSQLQLAQGVFNIQNSLERAQKNNPKLLAAQEELSIAKTDLLKAKSLYYPHVNFNLNYVRYRNETLGVTDPDLGYAILEAPLQNAAGGPRSNPFAENLYLGRLGFKQTLYAGGRIHSAYKLSQAKVARAESQYESLKADIELQARRGFYILLAISQKRDLITKGLAEIQQLAQVVKGAHNKLAIAALRSDLRRSKVQIDKEEKKARFEFLQAMGLELFTPVQIEGSLLVPHVDLEIQKALAWAKQNRPEYKQTQIEQEVDRLSVHLAMAERYPVFLLGGAYEFRNRKFPLEENNWNAVLSMNIPLFSGFSSLARIKGSRHKAKQGRYLRVQLDDQVEREVRTAYDNFFHWQEELKIRQSELGFLQNQRSRYTSKKPSNLGERIDFIRWHLDARLDVIDARHQLIVSHAQLERAVGRPLK